MSRTALMLRHLQQPMVVLAIVLVLAGLVRFGLAFRAPLFVTGDSEGYLVPAHALAHGQDLDLSLKRTPAYPMFIAISLFVQGDSLQSLGLLQHLVGLVTVAAVFWLGRMLGGTLVGGVAAAITACSGTLLIAEHSLMTEALFIPILTLMIATSVAATQRLGYGMSFLAGALLGLAVLVRPVALSLAPLLFLAPIVQHGWNRRAIAAGSVSVLAVGVIFGAWSLRPGKADDAAIGGLGQTLIGRTARHDRGGFTYWSPDLHGAESEERQQVRRILQEAVDRGSSGRAVHTRIRKETGLSAADADALMRDLAVDTIRDQFGYYAQGTLLRFVRLAQPSPERLRDARNVNDVARQRWEDEPTRPLIAQDNSTYDREASAAEAITSAVQLGRVGAGLPLLALLGAAALAWRRQAGAAFLLTVSTLTLLLLSAALVGNVSRYRYPVDPFMVVLAIAGLTAVGQGVVQAVSRRRTPGSHQAASAAIAEATQ